MAVDTIFVTTSAVDTSTHPWMTANHKRMLRAGAAYRGGDFRLADGPERADFILFVDSSEPYLGDVYRSPVFRRFSERCYVHNGSDAAVPVLPGMYSDVPGPVRLPALQLGAFYIRCFDNQALTPRVVEHDPGRLFSFVGNSRNSPDVRGRILALRHSEALLVDRSSGLRDDDLDYVATLRDSRFVLCPRGIGPTSWRFYETMMASRVPVIVSDLWLPAREIDWPSFSFQVREAEIDSIPQLCEANAHRAREMGLRAREEWERCCALDTAFGWVGRRLRELREARAVHPVRFPLDFIRDLAWRHQLLRYARWRAGRVLRAYGLR